MRIALYGNAEAKRGRDRSVGTCHDRLRGWRRMKTPRRSGGVLMLGSKFQSDCRRFRQPANGEQGSARPGERYA